MIQTLHGTWVNIEFESTYMQLIRPLVELPENNTIFEVVSIVLILVFAAAL